MTDADRLLEGGSERERALLQAGATERPSTESVRAAARVLGLLPRAALVAYFVWSLVKSLKGPSMTAYVVGPAMAIALAGALVYGTAARHAGLSGKPGTAPRAAAPVTMAPAVGPEGAPDAPVVAPAAASPSPVALVSSPGPTPSPVRAPVAAWPESAPVHDAVSDVRRQVAWIDHARSLADSADTAGALRELDGYDRVFPHGVLVEESTLLRIQVLLARRDRRAAGALARHFLADHPHSVHVDKVRALLDSSD
jgi:hypothetical protein